MDFSFVVVCLVFVSGCDLSIWGVLCFIVLCVFFFFKAKDGVRDSPYSLGLGDVYSRQGLG